ncbi:hypothetical protein FHS90_003602 [Rufibacter quisquiliarum]|uniref:Uncharacterized protein n=1 Tax=Rufibacter quisquiliarum TaxID=1549639 RepID=A0A839GJ39_9BACT|nr:hypothetical protein [Rufibacter quisquiliarum]
MNRNGRSVFYKMNLFRVSPLSVWEGLSRALAFAVADVSGLLFRKQPRNRVLPYRTSKCLRPPV